MCTRHRTLPCLHFKTWPILPFLSSSLDTNHGFYDSRQCCAAWLALLFFGRCCSFRSGRIESSYGVSCVGRGCKARTAAAASCRCFGSARSHGQWCRRTLARLSFVALSPALRFGFAKEWFRFCISAAPLTSSTFLNHQYSFIFPLHPSLVSCVRYPIPTMRCKFQAQ